MVTIVSRAFSLVSSLLCTRYTAFFLGLLVYAQILNRTGGLPFAWSFNLRFELPVLLYLYFYLNTVTRPFRLQAVVTAIPLLLLYGMFDLYYMQLGGLLRFAEISEVPELLSLIPLWARGILFLILGAFTFNLLRFVQWRRPRLLMLASVPLILLLLIIEILPDWFLCAYETSLADVISYSDARSATQNGRLGMALYNEARRKSLLAKTAYYLENPYYLTNMDELAESVRQHRGKRNVHLLVLESFLDPELLADATFSQSPTHPDFAKIFKRNGSLSISPVFGGGTAQAEFEVLCGVPALREIAGVEFNAFTGAQTPCLPHVLNQGGYHTMATNAFRPEFFNSTDAYQGVGFQDAYYPVEYAPNRKTYVSAGDVEEEIYMFDGTLLRQNLDYLRDWLKQHPDTPIFNYVISMYGHTPSLLDEKKRPKFITTQGKLRDWQLENSVNQYYYRTGALAAYIRELVALDPDSLIILVSDHLPPLHCGQDTYRQYNYLQQRDDYMHLNRIFFLEKGKPVRYETIHHYDLPRIILNYVTRENRPRKKAPLFTNHHIPFERDAYHKAYLTIMAKAMSSKDMPPAIQPPAVALLDGQAKDTKPLITRNNPAQMPQAGILIH